VRYRYRNGKREYIYGDPPVVVRFCLGPFQDAAIWACERAKRTRNRPAKRKLIKAAARKYGVECSEIQRWRGRGKKVA
jgi:hypothetical protein